MSVTSVVFLRRSLGGSLSWFFHAAVEGAPEDGPEGPGLPLERGK